MMLRVTTMEILKLSHWNPAKNMKTVLIDIKEFLQTWARLDYKSERNDRNRYPDGAYIDIEHHLLRLALVSLILSFFDEIFYLFCTKMLEKKLEKNLSNYLMMISFRNHSSLQQ